MSQVGSRIELVGRIHAVKRGVGKRGRGRLQPYVFVNFGHWRGNIVKLTIWSEGLAQLNEVPDEKWIGRWVSVVGLVDQPYSGKHYNLQYNHVGITIHVAQQINIITENEANFRLGRISGSTPALSSVSVTSQSNLLSPQIGGSRSANQDILRALRQHVALGSPSVQTMPPSPLPVSPGASTPSRTESLTSRLIRVLRLGRLWHSELARASVLAVASITGLLIVISVIPHSPSNSLPPQPSSPTDPKPSSARAPQTPITRGPDIPSKSLPAHLAGKADGVWDAATVSVGGQVKLFGVRIESTTYAEEMRQYLKGEQLSCDRQDKKGQQVQPVAGSYQCRISGNIDIAEHALLTGWVKRAPQEDVPVSYRNAEDYARAQRRGVWANIERLDDRPPSRLLAPTSPPNQWENRSFRTAGPSFPCTKATQPLALTICSDQRLSGVDLSFVQAYQALRQSGGALEIALRREAQEFQGKVLRECGIPQQGPAISETSTKNCIERLYTVQRSAWVSRLSGPAYEESTRPVERHIALQRDLTNLGYLVTTQTDGVYDPPTRRAISMWQRSQGLVETGILTDADALALERAALNTPHEGTSPAGGSIPQSGSVRVCGMNEPYSVDQTATSDPNVRFRGVWAGNWNEGRVCAWLIVRAVSTDGTAQIQYGYVDVHGQRVFQSGQSQIQDNKLIFKDKDGSLFSFTLDRAETKATPQLNGSFTDSETRTFDANFGKLL
jgi:peptidoglycan hydrolase-like protein with peptidoglycan-binding domain